MIMWMRYFISGRLVTKCIFIFSTDIIMSPRFQWIMETHFIWIGTRIVLKFSPSYFILLSFIYNFYYNFNFFTKSWQLQAIQSTSDGRNCKQEVLINGSSIWSRSLTCPRILTETQLIYFSGLDPRDVEVRNFQFFTHPVWLEQWTYFLK